VHRQFAKPSQTPSSTAPTGAFAVRSSPVETAFSRLKRFKPIVLRSEKPKTNFVFFVAPAIGFILVQFVETAWKNALDGAANCQKRIALP
jgi:hypothetical protein